jgi:SAM-dependent methyltransferase
MAMSKMDGSKMPAIYAVLRPAKLFGWVIWVKWVAMRFERSKPRSWLASIGYKLVKIFPASTGRKLDFLLDLEWVVWRLAFERAADLGIHRPKRNAFLHDRIESSHRVLDLGCGNGSLTAQIKAARVVGVDHHDYPNRVPGPEYIKADARDYLASGHQFDVLVMSHVLEHLDDPEAILAFAAANFSLIYIEVPDFESQPLNAFRVLRGRRLIYSDNDHVAEYTRDEIETLFDGFDILDREFNEGVMRYWLADADHQRGTIAIGAPNRNAT